MKAMLIPGEERQPDTTTDELLDGMFQRPVSDAAGKLAVMIVLNSQQEGDNAFANCI